MKKERFTVYRDTDYMYVSALARAKEKGIIGKEGLNRLIDSDPMPILAEYGYLPSAKEELSPEERNSALDEAVSASFDEIESALPSFDGETHSVLTPLRYPYDCNNIKAAIKCSIHGVSTEGMLFSSGTLSAETAQKVAEGEFKEDQVRPNRKSRTAGLPQNMYSAAKEAKERYAATKDPRVIDLLLDRACFADMLEAAEAMGVPFLTDYVKLKIDVTNILTAIRIDRLYSDRAEIAGDLLVGTLIPGGKLPISPNGGDREAIAELMRRDSRFEKTASAVADGKSLSEIEKELDSVISDFIIGSKRVSFGADVPVGYMLGLELSVKNIRIVMAGREAGLDGSLIRERMRESYV